MFIGIRQPQALQSENMPNGKDCQFMARSGLYEPAEVRVLMAGAKAGLPRGEAQDTVGGRRLILEDQ
jgi:hypothetical protein